MTTFDERERAYEKKFVIDQELKFRAEALEIGTLRVGLLVSLGFAVRQPRTARDRSEAKVSS
jgi:hypothetical protein